MADQKVKVRVEAEDRTGAATAKVESRFKRMTSSIRANALKITAAIAGIAVAFRQIESSAEQVGQKKALERTLAAQGIAIDDYLGKLKDLSDNQIANSDLILASNRALKLGLEADDIPGLLTIAANSAIELGLSTTQAFDDIVTGLGRASPMILDNLGIQLDATAASKAYAESIGKTTEELTKEERTLALTQAVLKSSGDAIKDFETRQDSLTRSINRGRAAMENVKNSAGSMAGALVQAAAGGVTVLGSGLLFLLETLTKVVRGIVYLGTLLPGVGDSFEVAAEKLKGFDDGLDESQENMARLTRDLYSGALATAEFALGLDKTEASAGRAASQYDKVADAANKAKEATEDVASTNEDAVEAEDKITEAVKRHTEALEGYTAVTGRATEAQRVLSRQTEETTRSMESAAGPLFEGLSGSSYTFTREATLADIRGSLQQRGGALFYQGRQVRVLPDGRVEFV